MIDLHIAPYFNNREIADITNTDIRYWQNEMLKKICDRTKKLMLKLTSAQLIVN